MNCPHCSAILASDADECPNCRFNVAVIRSYLGSEWVRLERLTDHLDCLSLKERRHLEIVLDDYERMFPQCFFAVYMGNLPPVITARDLGFWLINHGAFHTQQIAKRNDFGCALVVDTNRQISAITLGYALEPILKFSDLELILRSSRKHFERRLYGRAIEEVVGLLGKHLRKAGSKVNPDTLTNALGLSDVGELGLYPLRATHRPLRLPH